MCEDDRGSKSIQARGTLKDTAAQTADDEGSVDAPPGFHENLWSLCIKDHNNQPVEISWVRRQYEGSTAALSTPFPVYVLDSAPRTAACGNLPELFAKWMDCGRVFGKQQGRDRRPRDHVCHFEFHRPGFVNVLACIDHQRHEVEHRNSTSDFMHLMSNWADYLRCRNCPHEAGFILVIDRDDWTQEGVLQVTFGQPPHSKPWVGHDRSCDRDKATVLDIRHRQRHALFEDLRERCGLFMDGPTKHSDELSYFTREENTKRLRMIEQRKKIRLSMDEDERQICAFDQARLLTVSQWPGLRMHHHVDDYDWQVSNVWNPSLSKRRPELSFALYVADDVPSLSLGALYTLLREGAPEGAAWTLDTIWQLPNASTALQHYLAEASEWPNKRVVAQRSVTTTRENVFRRAAGHILPEELLLNISSLSAPDPCEDQDTFDPLYAASNPSRIFMFLNAATLGSGPQIAIVNPSVINSKIITPRTSHDRRLETAWKCKESPNPATAIQIRHYRSWQKVAERLHTFWSLRVPRSTKFRPEDLPYFVCDVVLPAVCKDCSCPDIEIFLTLHHSAKSITALEPILDEMFLFEHLSIVDFETGAELDLRPLPSSREEEPLELDSSVGWCGAERWTFGPGERGEVFLKSSIEYEWWCNLVARNSMEEGRRYSVRVKGRAEVRMWTFGNEDEMEGPWNLPGVRVEAGVEEGFVFGRA